MKARSPEAALSAAADWLVAQDAPEAAIAAHEVGAADSKDDARRWVRRIVDGEKDGAWGGELLATARALLLLHELRQAAALKEQDPAIGRALDWVRDREGRPGAWTDGCSPDRHRRGLCHHFAGGFFSPAPPDASLGEVDLPEGARTSGETESRFAVSAVALRCTLLWLGEGTTARVHLDALHRVVRLWPEAPPDGLTTTALLAAVHALLGSETERDRGAAETAVRIVAGRQRGDGSWLDADPFHALAVFGTAAAAGVGGDRAERALGHGARLLVAAQREDGSWGPEYGARRALIGLRTLRRSS